MEKNQYQKKKEADGYVVVEAAVLLPLASIFIVLLIGLCSYLYQGCFLMQAAYTVAFRSAAQERPDAGYADGQLNQLLEGEVLSFGKEICRRDNADTAFTRATIDRWKKILEIKERFEDQIGCSIYALLPGVMENSFR